MVLAAREVVKVPLRMPGRDGHSVVEHREGRADHVPGDTAHPPVHELLPEQRPKRVGGPLDRGVVREAPLLVHGAQQGPKVADQPRVQRLIDALRAKAASVAAQNGSVEFLFSTRELANEAIDSLRAEQCTIESLSVSSSSLEEVFVRTVDA